MERKPSFSIKSIFSKEGRKPTFTTAGTSINAKTIVPLSARDVGIPTEQLTKPEGIQQLRKEFLQEAVNLPNADVDVEKSNMQLHFAKILKLDYAGVFEREPELRERLIKAARDPLYLEYIDYFTNECVEVLDEPETAFSSGEKGNAALLLGELKKMSELSRINQQPQFRDDELPRANQEVIIKTWQENWPLIEARFEQYTPARIKEGILDNLEKGEEADVEMLFKQVLEAEKLGLLQDEHFKAAIKNAGDDPILREALHLKLKSELDQQNLSSIQQSLHLAVLFGMDQPTQYPNYQPFFKFINQVKSEYLPRSEEEVVISLINNAGKLVEQYRLERLAGRDGTNIDLDSFLKDVEDLELLGGLQNADYKTALLAFGADPVVRYAMINRIADYEDQFLASANDPQLLKVLKHYIHLGELLGLNGDANNPTFREAVTAFNKIREKYIDLVSTPTTEPIETPSNISPGRKLEKQLDYYKELYWLREKSGSSGIPLDQLLRALRITFHQNLLLKMKGEGYEDIIRDQQDEMRWLSEERDVYLLRIEGLEIRLGRESRAVAYLKTEVDKLNKISGALYGENSELKAQLDRLGIHLSEAVRNGVHLSTSNASLTNAVTGLRSQLEKAQEELEGSKAENEKMKGERQQDPEWIKGQQGFVKIWRAARTNLPQLKPGETGNEPNHVLNRFKAGMGIVHEVSLDSDISVPVLGTRTRAGIEYLIPEIWPGNRILTRFFERPQELLSLTPDDLAKVIYIPEKYRSLTIFDGDQKRNIARIYRVLMTSLHTDIKRPNTDPDLEESIANLLKYFNPAWTIVEKLIR